MKKGRETGNGELYLSRCRLSAFLAFLGNYAKLISFDNGGSPESIWNELQRLASLLGDLFLLTDGKIVDFIHFEQIHLLLIDVVHGHIPGWRIEVKNATRKAELDALPLHNG